jgi:hypothetical protein
MANQLILHNIKKMTTTGSYYFYIVNRFDSLIYENEFQKSEKKVFEIVQILNAYFYRLN